MAGRTAAATVRLRQSRYLSHIIASALPFAALAVQLSIEPLAPQTSYQLFVGAVAISALLGGVADGVLTLVISGAGRFLFFPPPRILFAADHPAVLIRLGLFVVIGAVVAWLVGRLQIAQGQLAAALASTQDAIAITDARRRIVFLNPVAEALTGVDYRCAAGQPLDSVVRVIGDRGGNAGQVTGATATNERVEADALLVSKDGSRRPVEHSTAPIVDAAGEFRGVIAVLRDVSARRELEGQLRQAQKMEALGRLAGGVAHDFNNLLTVITGHTELVAGAPAASETIIRSAEAIRSAADRAARLTRQLLIFSQRQKVRLRALDLNVVLKSIEPMLRTLAGNNVEVDLDLDPQLGRVKADAGQIEQVVMNLALNARDAIPGPGTVTIRTRNVTLESGYSDDTDKRRSCVALEVADTGSGMDEATKSRIFEPFFSTKAKGKGTGLGLAIVYGIVEQSGGHIQVMSERGRGSTFSVFLPRTDEAEDCPDPPAQTVSDDATGVILLAEDYDGVRDLVTAILGSAGYSVLTARNGDQALQVAAAELNRIDLVVTDVDMPVVSGPEMMTCLWTLRPELKVLYLSGNRDPLAEQSAGSDGRTKLLAKPFTPDALLTGVAELLAARSSAAEEPC